MQRAGSKSKLRRARPAFRSSYRAASWGAMKFQSSSAACRVGAMPSAMWAVFRSRETTASWPSREPSLRVASFMAPIVLQCSEGAQQAHSQHVLVIVIVDQALAIAREQLGVALEVPGQRKGPAELHGAAPGRTI